MHGADCRKIVDGLTEKFGKADEVAKKRASDSQSSVPVPMAKKIRFEVSWAPLEEMAGEETQKAGLFRAFGFSGLWGLALNTTTALDPKPQALRCHCRTSRFQTGCCLCTSASGPRARCIS